jgi:hypothetical protein
MCRACFELCHKGHQATFKHRCNMYWWVPPPQQRCPARMHTILNGVRVQRLRAGA